MQPMQQQYGAPMQPMQPMQTMQPMQPMQPVQQMVLAERIELYIAMGDSTKSDTFCVVYLKNSRNKDFEKIGQTQVMDGCPNPIRWRDKFPMNYFFEEEQTLKFDIYSQTKKGKKTQKLKDHKLVGTTSCILGEIFHEPGSIIQKKLTNKSKPIKNKKTKKFTHLIIFAGKVKDIHDTRNIKIQFTANNLIKADKLGLSDPYFLIIRNNNVVYGDRKRHLKTTVNPKWPPFHIDTQTLCNNDPKAPLTIEL